MPTATGSTPDAVMAKRRKLDVRPVFKRIDTCAAEFASPTAYMYSTYETPFAGTVANEAEPSDGKKVVILGGGFGSVSAARRLEKLSRRRPDVEVTLVSQNNFFMLTPLLFEACSGRLELRHCAQPIRPALPRTRFLEASVERVDPEGRVVRAVDGEGAAYELPYDHLIVGLGATTNEALIPGSASAMTFTYA